MSSKRLVVPLALALAGCATSPPAPPAADGGPVPTLAKPGPTPAGWAVSVVGTPFALGFKTVICAASLVIAAPIAGLLVLNPDPFYDGLGLLGDGIANNCGPPYVIPPSAAG